MFIKAFLICAVAAVAMGIEYPAGIDPLLCPDYPYCNMELMARYKTLPYPYYPGYQIPYARMAYPGPYPAPYPIVAPVPIPVAEPVPVPEPVAEPVPEPVPEPEPVAAPITED
ncbi:nematocyst expressed protein 4-like [Leguminivora glycinivorella]|uniref:nematocyst expressed protein 4-like n=1 Tax=Leguminivora glycinivorella TaxID=1035111 RepID=UPI002010BC8E|nr:nematocyst expressed protein 4-like [Leguminivora glycinivorella]